jgi:hypothetical protein
MEATGYSEISVTTGHTQKNGATVTGNSFLDMLESWLLPQTEYQL